MGVIEAFLVLKTCLQTSRHPNYEFKVSHFWHSTTGETIGEHYGPQTKNILDKYVGLARPFSHAQWLLELASLAIKSYNELGS